MQGYVHSIESFGTVDGDGIRFVVFLAGCHLGCKFCHNPDSWQIGCGKPTTVDELLDKMEDYRPYFEASGGGITITGGDPLVQPDFTAELLKGARKRGVHSCLETSGYGKEKDFARLVPLADTVIFGLKGFSNGVYKQLTAHGNTTILSNLAALGRLKETARLRYLVIPGITDTAEEVSRMASFLKMLPCRFYVEPIPYHTMGIAKWEALGRPYLLGELREPTDADMAEFAQRIKEQDLNVIGDVSSRDELSA